MAEKIIHTEGDGIISAGSTVPQAYAGASSAGPAMAADRFDDYAVELTRRFEELTRWAVEHWPDKQNQLLQSDFERSRREFSYIAGARLGEGDPNISPHAEAGQYKQVTPMPWP